MKIRQAVVLCGGLGTRLRPDTDHLPKPMIPVNGVPFLECLLEQLRDQGIKRVVLLTGYRGHQIENHFGDGVAFGLRITYSRGAVEWETGRRIWEARDLLDAQHLLLYGDNFVPFNLAAAHKFHLARSPALTLLLAGKAKGNVKVDSDGRVVRYDPRRSEPGLDHVEIGYMIVERDQVLPELTDPDISFSTVLQRLAGSANVVGMVTGDHYHSVSDPERWKLTEQYMRLKRIILIDREGTLNIRPPVATYISRWEDFQWNTGALEGLAALSDVGFSFILISNQAGIGRGLLTQEQVDAINHRVGEELNKRGVNLLACYVCPHHWDANCKCRKPAPGMFFQASRDFLLRLDRTVYIGDDPRDCQSAYNARALSVYVGKPSELYSIPAAERPTHTAPTILAAVPWIKWRFEAWDATKSKIIAASA
jgi:histidinol-phosphate phosphatase family protein